MLPQDEFDALILPQQVNVDMGTGIQPTGIIGVDLHVEVALHIALRIEIERNTSGVFINDERIWSNVFGTVTGLQAILNRIGQIVMQHCIPAAVSVNSADAQNLCSKMCFRGESAGEHIYHHQ